MSFKKTIGLFWRNINTRGESYHPSPSKTITSVQLGLGSALRSPRCCKHHSCWSVALGNYKLSNGGGEVGSQRKKHYTNLLGNWRSALCSWHPELWQPLLLPGFVPEPNLCLSSGCVKGMSTAARGWEVILRLIRSHISICQPRVKDLLFTLLAEVHLVLRQEMTVKQEGGPGEKLQPCWPWGETTYPVPRAGPLLRPELCS